MQIMSGSKLTKFKAEPNYYLRRLNRKCSARTRKHQTWRQFIDCTFAYAMFSHEWRIIEISKLESRGINLREEWLSIHSRRMCILQRDNSKSREAIEQRFEIVNHTTPRVTRAEWCYRVRCGNSSARCRSVEPRIDPCVRNGMCMNCCCCVQSLCYTQWCLLNALSKTYSQLP